MSEPCDIIRVGFDVVSFGKALYPHMLHLTQSQLSKIIVLFFIKVVNLKICCAILCIDIIIQDFSKLLKILCLLLITFIH